MKKGKHHENIKLSDEKNKRKAQKSRSSKQKYD